MQEESLVTMRGDNARKFRDLHASVSRDVTTMFEGKSSAELAKLRANIEAKIEHTAKLVDLHSGRKQEKQGV